MLRNALERSTHPSPQQIAALLQYLEEHPELARGFPKLPAAKNKIKKQWEQLAPRLNSLGRSVKSWQQWTKYWADKKLAVKRKAAMREAALKNGSDPDLIMELSDLEQHILALGCRDYAPRTPRPPRPLSQENSSSELDMVSAGEAETLVVDNSEQVVLLVSPATLVQEGSPQPQSPLATLSSSPSPPPQTLYRSSRSRPPDVGQTSAPPPYRFSGIKHRRRDRSVPPHPAETSGRRRSHLAILSERFLALEEQRLELERRNTSILETVAGVAGQLMERDFERERVFAQALQTVGDGLRLLAEALRKDEPTDNM